MSDRGESEALRATIPGLFRKQDDPYAGADPTNAKRLGALLYVIGGAIALVIVPLAPPTAAVSRVGWPVAALVVGGAFAAAVGIPTGLVRRLGPRARPDPPEVPARSGAGALTGGSVGR